MINHLLSNKRNKVSLFKVNKQLKISNPMESNLNHNDYLYYEMYLGIITYIAMGLLGIGYYVVLKVTTEDE
jgi:hypothetical protein